MCRVLSRLLVVLVALLLAGCNLRQGNITNTPPPTPDAPRVRFLFPPNASTILEGAELRVELLAEDSGEGVARVELLVDDILLDEGQPEIAPAVPTFTVTMGWLAEGVGNHSLSAVAYRQDGTASPPTTIFIQVLPGPQSTEAAGP